MSILKVHIKKTVAVGPLSIDVTIDGYMEGNHADVAYLKELAKDANADAVGIDRLSIDSPDGLIDRFVRAVKETERL